MQHKLGQGRGKVVGSGGAGVGGKGGGGGGGRGVDRKFPQTRAAHRKKGFTVLEREKIFLWIRLVVTH